GGGAGDVSYRGAAAAAAAATAAIEEAAATAAIAASAAARQEAVAAAVGLLSELRERYFQPVATSSFRSSFSSASSTFSAAAQCRADRDREISPTRHRTAAISPDSVNGVEGAAAAPESDAGGNDCGASGVGGAGAGSVVSELEAALGVRLRDPEPERVAAALEAFLSRHQLLLAGPGSGLLERDTSPLRPRGAGSSPSRQQRPVDASYQPQSPGASPASTGSGGGWLRPVVSELACLEGCLLVALLDRRVGTGRSSGGGRSASCGGASDGTSSGGGGSSSCGSGGCYGREARGQVEQLVRAVISERKHLMQRIREMHNVGSQQQAAQAVSHVPASASPATFPLYTPGSGNNRRLVSSASPATSSAAPPQPSHRGGPSSDRSAGSGGFRAAVVTQGSVMTGTGPVPGTSWTSPGEATEPLRFNAGPYGSSSYNGVGGGEPEATVTPRSSGTRRVTSEQPRSFVRRSTDTEFVMGSPAAGAGAGIVYGADGGGNAAAVGPAECMLPPLPNPYGGTQVLGPGGSPLQAPDMDELMDVLQALDDSALRRSRCAAALPQSRRQAAWTAWDGPGAAGGDTGSVTVQPLSRRGGGGNALGTPPKVPNRVSGGGGGGGGGASPGGGYGGGGYDVGTAPASSSRSMGRTVSWSGP
ncbi:hypothetical protein VaNZ11_002731, partial [Volvox africanus]